MTDPICLLNTMHTCTHVDLRHSLTAGVQQQQSGEGVAVWPPRPFDKTTSSSTVVRHATTSNANGDKAFAYTPTRSQVPTTTSSSGLHGAQQHQIQLSRHHHAPVGRNHMLHALRSQRNRTRGGRAGKHKVPMHEGRMGKHRQSMANAWHHRKRQQQQHPEAKRPDFIGGRANEPTMAKAAPVDAESAMAPLE